MKSKRKQIVSVHNTHATMRIDNSNAVFFVMGSPHNQVSRVLYISHLLLSLTICAGFIDMTLAGEDTTR